MRKAKKGDQGKAPGEDVRHLNEMLNLSEAYRRCAATLLMETRQGSSVEAIADGFFDMAEHVYPDNPLLHEDEEARAALARNEALRQRCQRICDRVNTRLANPEKQEKNQ